MIEIIPLQDMPEVVPGDDLSALIAAALADANVTLRTGDILVVTQKIVSKAENRFVDLSSITPDETAIALAERVRKDPRLVSLVLAESTAIVRTAPNVLITRHRLGLVMANAGIDASNLGKGDGERVLLLPEDPDASARRIAEGLSRLCGVAPGVVISDSFGRPWRYGVVNVGIGACGIEALIDRRGERDRDGRELLVTQVALADLIASAAGLAAGEGAEGIPVVVVRGYAQSPHKPATALIRPPEEDLFR
ncbi:MAG: coenzyme F420-0:L-glutamate ligase [Caulobacterales bacterium]